LKAQDEMERYVDHHRRDVQLEVGDWVYLKIQLNKMKYLAKKLNEKLSLRYYGLYKIFAKVVVVAYQLELPPYSKIHSMFHVAILKKSYIPYTKVSTPT